MPSLCSLRFLVIAIAYPLAIAADTNLTVSSSSQSEQHLDGATPGTTIHIASGDHEASRIEVASNRFRGSTAPIVLAPALNHLIDQQALIGRGADGLPKKPYFTCDFESQKWFDEWGERDPGRRVTTVAQDAKRRFEPLSGKALRIRVDRGDHYGASIQYRFKERLGWEPEAVYFRYYLRLADDWTPERGGKLPGIAGTYGKAGWGGRPVDGTDGWSARGLFQGRKDGGTPIGYYCYHADMKGRYGSGWVWNQNGHDGRLENNRWYCIEQYAQLNTPGVNDGILRGWIDGELAFERTDVRMRDVPTLKIETIWLNVYLGGSWTAKSDHHLYIDNVVIAPTRIGPDANANDANDR